MHNVEYVVKGNKLIVTMDVSAATINGAQPSSSGKTNAVASTGGFTAVDGKPGLSLSINLAQKPNR